MSAPMRLSYVDVAEVHAPVYLDEQQGLRLGEHGWLLYPLLLFLLPNDWRVGGLALAPESILLLVTTYGVFLRRILTGRTLQDFHGLRVSPLLLASAGTILIALLLPDIARGDVNAPRVARLALWGLTFYFGALFAGSIQSQLAVRRLWVGCGIGTASYALARHGSVFPPEVNVFAWQHRTALGYFLAIGSVLALFSVLGRRTTSGRLALSVVGAALILVALVQTHSRGAWLGFVIALITVGIVTGRRLRLLLTAIGAALVILFAASRGQDSFADRTLSLVDTSINSSNVYRFTLYKAALAALPTVGFVGGGQNTAQSVLRRHSEVDFGALRDTSSFSTDSDVIWLGLEGGLIGLIGLVSFLGCWTVSSVRGAIRYRRAGGEAWDLVEFNLALLVIVTMMVVLDNVLSSPYGWFLLGVGASGAREIAASARLTHEPWSQQ